MILGNREHEKTNFQFWGTGEQANLFQGNMGTGTPPRPPPPHPHPWEGLVNGCRPQVRSENDRLSKGKYTGTHMLTAIIDASWKVNACYNCVCMRRGDCYICIIHFLCTSTVSITFCFLIIKQSRVCKISVRFDLQKFPMLPLTDNQNPCNPWTFQLMVYKCGR